MMKKRLESLEQRLAALEQHPAKSDSGPSVRWGGVWKNGRTFQPGEFVTHGGSLWLCKQASSDPPNRAPDIYTLIVKRGAFDDR